MDNVRLGDLRVERQRFGELERDGQLFEYASFDGGLGLDLAAEDEEGKVSIVRNLADQGAIDHAVFSLYLNNTMDSHVLLGGVDEEHFIPPLVEIPVPKDAASWEVKMDGRVFGDKGIQFESMRASFDSMSAFIGLLSKIAFYL